MNRRIHGAVLLAVSAAVVTFGPVTPAGAQTPFKAPEVTFAGTAPGIVTATLHNPNDRGQCWAEAGVGPNNDHVFFGNGAPESLAQPGQTVKTTLEGLEPGTTISARGGCHNGAEFEFSELVQVAVPADMPATGSFGS
ncbi:hypothetical protein [Nocardia donostiensis]|uniref:Uncharacterized protein n=1 Tax=Nocardia donostiensis TaxID=1538463 RepID=A0A1V2TIT6_9NOCA|nr:hypothetical protein [Nocardia donostiensis]ONM49261.1 hypothetical protein B0T46_07665 [Nocardia donostiensis]OQS14782.1 hypothetical protein B0T36_11925 [Nocardia donostiensis]OQS21785.1 hypothetical protein B0T44_06620 [Nocardia donostiensis]